MFYSINLNKFAVSQSLILTITMQINIAILALSEP